MSTKISVLTPMSFDRPTTCVSHRYVVAVLSAMRTRCILLFSSVVLLVSASRRADCRVCFHAVFAMQLRQKVLNKMRKQHHTTANNT
ncbi:uncharacterized protein M421DRAFT_311274 [Didymella exigua CBS 183.55]|uniref:Uncharacterized protein n=1 Tax=Didymella exigua CBS 183.55 TaxID=1150837 RepID=A0A6A5R7A1_9PLEO|nr:uncharacterized protein M421DRAFT_311274 [Didymella exigua CBS 183.55]KAF1923493.1 hypothetical protein M421DRAFT_311274 [Didymella exigua CBS 183.55]